MDDYPPATWRLIHSAPADGATNMALDEAILRAVAAGLAPSTIRLYSWEPACLSLGRAQPAADVDLAALHDSGFDLVRRPTGGRAILHVDELTYSIVAPQRDSRVAGTIVESYRRLSAGLARGLELLGIERIAADRPAAHRSTGPVCFETPSDYEITVAGRKLVGSAQMRARGMVLQHGAVPLYGDIARICQLLVAHPDPARVRGRAATVQEVLGRPVTWDEAAAAITAGLAAALNLRLEPGALTQDELAWAKELRAQKYAAPDWTQKPNRLTSHG